MTSNYFSPSTLILCIQVHAIQSPQLGVWDSCSCALKNLGGKYFYISHIRWGISLFQYLIYSLWISLDEIHLQMMQENNSDQQDWGIYNKVPGCKTQYVNNLWNKENFFFMHINCYLRHVFTKIIYNLFYVVVKAIWERYK